MKEFPDYMKLWGKADTDDNGNLIWHPLAYHMLDVAAVAEIWLSEDEKLQSVFSKLINTKNNKIIQTLTLAAAFHDVGKATIGFQNKIPELTKEFRLEYAPAQNTQFDHGKFGVHWIEELRESDSEFSLLQEKYSFIGDDTFLSLWKAACWHHGSLIKYSESDQYANGFREINSKKNQIFEVSAKYRNKTLEYITEGIIQDFSISNELKISPSLVRLFAGFVSVCDWIGSDKEYFEYIREPFLSKEYYKQAKLKALQVLNDLGILFKMPHDFINFKDLFPQIKTPRPIQQKLDEVEKTIDPYLLIIEAPTGEGKTESALFSFSRNIGRGFYFGLPTKASANQISKRIAKFLKENLRTLEPAILAHGTAWLQREKGLADDKSYDANASTELDKDAESELNDWFFSKKRTLLAHYGVGTVDQAMLAALNVKHGFVKLFGLSGKTLIIDEVHAYDSFMLPILERLLAWCGFLKTNVVLLSATLPNFMKEQLVSAYLGKPLITKISSDYPLITLLNKNQSIQQIGEMETRKKESIKIEFSTHEKDDIEVIVNTALKRIEATGDILWICNTIAKAQKVYGYFKKYKEKNKDNFYLKLFHARFTVSDRLQIEEEIEDYFGPEEKSKGRPVRGILISTQVAEQSLDIDFDYLITDIAPIDLLLQRMGRVHRHIRSNRSSEFMNPATMLLVPESSRQIKDFASMYDSFTICKTILALSKMTDNTIQLPSMYRNLVEEVYNDSLPNENTIELKNISFEMDKNDWSEYRKQAKEKRESSIYKGVQGCIPMPETEIENISDSTLLSEEENSYFAAKTRDGDENLELVPVYFSGNQYYIGNLILSESIPDKLSMKTLKTIAENTVPVGSPKSFVIAMMKTKYIGIESIKLLKNWQEKMNKTSILKDKKIILLDKNQEINLRTSKSEFSIYYSQEFGMKIHKINRET
ncbi:CRISPR-associated helicase Cas3' [Leptospira sp. 85282-16]|uniref:CRISPR-associated helicase Cas3' n=1 Tax=Leptospira sp. 85282-16 TaxID=2971256 RepID=UPI0021C0256D|nr:CRISPR-associated helicase Cas3' [Leptospira sp. 85282-16]MCT8335192.1 CRISPR-associated helicase Cas3' [Leptospira sp. 85282-16]